MYKNKKHFSIRIFFLALFLSYYADITFFAHTHIVNGVTIVHSHYTFSKHSSKPGKQEGHTHQANVLISISQASSWHAVFQALPQVPTSSFYKQIAYYIITFLNKDQATPSQFYLRGPPMFS